MTAGVFTFNTFNRSAYFASFSGTQYLTNSALLGSNGKQFTLSFWMKTPSSFAVSTAQNIFATEAGSKYGIKVSIQFATGANASTMTVLSNGDSGVTLWATKSTTFTTSTNYYIMLVCDMTQTNPITMAKDEVNLSQTFSTITRVNDSLSLSTQSYICKDMPVDGARDAQVTFKGQLYDLWLDDVKLTSASAFYDNSGAGSRSKPLGASGQYATGNVPLIYLNGYGQFYNRGNGGNYVATGTIAQGGAAPI